MPSLAVCVRRSILKFTFQTKVKNRMMLFVAPVTFPKSVLVGLSSGLLHSTASKRFCTDREVPDDVRIHQEQPRTTHAVHTAAHWPPSRNLLC